MLQEVVLQTASPMVLKVESADPHEILVIRSISGLTSSGNTNYMGEYAREGGYYQGRRANRMNPVFTLSLNPNYQTNIEISDVRELLYEMFYEPLPHEDGVRVVLKDDRKPDRYFIGYTEDVNTDQFDQDQVAMVSLLTTESYLFSVDETVESGPGWVSRTIDYDGSARTGLEMTFEVMTSDDQMTIELNDVPLNLVGDFTVGDIITVNSVAGSRFIRQNGSDIMAAKIPGSQWPTLIRNSSNSFKVYGSTEGDGRVVMTEFKFRSCWRGI